MSTLALLACLTLAQTGPTRATPQERLDSSPRHNEWVHLERGERKLDCFVVFPEVKHKAPVVVVIHENKGLSDWVRSLCDQLAEVGVIAIAPDLLSGAGPGGRGTSAFASVDEATQVLYALPAEQVAADLESVGNYALGLEAGNGRLYAAGFCWGGSQSFAFATRRADLKAAFVFYGSAPQEPGALEKIACPVYGFYGENDARINAGLPATEEAMRAAGKTFEPVIYAGAGHGFLRAGEAADASEGNRSGRAAAWQRLTELLGSK